MIVGMDLAGGGPDRTAVAVIRLWRTTYAEHRATGRRYVGEALHVEAHRKVRPLAHPRLALARFDHYAAALPPGWRTGIVTDATGDHAKSGAAYLIGAEVEQRKAAGDWSGPAATHRPKVAAYRWTSGGTVRKVPADEAGRWGGTDYNAARGVLVGTLLSVVSDGALDVSGLQAEQRELVGVELDAMRTGTGKRGADHAKGGHDDVLAALAMAWVHGTTVCPGTSGGGPTLLTPDTGPPPSGFTGGRIAGPSRTRGKPTGWGASRGSGWGQRVT